MKKIKFTVDYSPRKKGEVVSDLSEMELRFYLSNGLAVEIDKDNKSKANKETVSKADVSKSPKKKK